ncbi:MAG: c-type cytochrome biogenesis protein CcsB [Candidatus Binatia bacterium]
MEIFLLQAALLFYLLSTGAFLLPILSTRIIPRTVGPGLLFVAFVFHTSAILLRSWSAGYIAVTNLYEGVSFLACLTTGLCLLVQLRTPVALLGAVVSPIGFILTLGAFIFYTQARALPPMLQSPWLPVHVTLAFLGYAVFGVAFSASLLYLVQERQLKAKKARIIFRRLPSLETLDELNYRSLSWGFPLLTLGILSGAVWAEYAWGQFWVWEPRLVLSVLTWLLYALLLYYRTAGWRGRRAATLTIVCFAVLLVSFLGVRILPGRHGGQFG